MNACVYGKISKSLEVYILVLPITYDRRQVTILKVI